MREEEFDALRSWGDALLGDPRAEVAAAGKAIQLLAAEVERLEMELWNLRLGVAVGDRTAEAGAPPDAGKPLEQPALADDLQLQVGRGRKLRSLLAPRSRQAHDR